MFCSASCELQGCYTSSPDQQSPCPRTASLAASVDMLQLPQCASVSVHVCAKPHPLTLTSLG